MRWSVGGEGRSWRHRYIKGRVGGSGEGGGVRRARTAVVAGTWDRMAAAEGGDGPR
jgi:hypothetical protein